MECKYVFPPRDRLTLYASVDCEFASESGIAFWKFLEPLRILRLDSFCNCFNVGHSGSDINIWNGCSLVKQVRKSGENVASCYEQLYQ